MKILITILLSCFACLSMNAMEKAKPVCNCKDCKCTPENHCGCMSKECKKPNENKELKKEETQSQSTH